MEINGRSAVSYLKRTPHALFFMLILIGLEAKGVLAFQGRRGIASVVQWNLRPVIFGAEEAALAEKVKKESPRVPGRPPERVKNEPPESKTGEQRLRETHF